MSGWERTRSDREPGSEQWHRRWVLMLTVGGSGVSYWWRASRGPTLIADGECYLLAEGMRHAEGAALAWVLCALAPRVGAWCNAIDADLARSYRAAVAAHRARLRLTLDAAMETNAEVERTGMAVDVAHDALMRGVL